jgi:Uma2 family endonuclease
MTLQTRMSASEFEQFIMLPENIEQNFEFIGGEIFPVVANQKSSNIAAKILGYIQIYLLSHPIGFLTGEAGGYIVAGERYMPDIGYISNQKQDEVPNVAYNPNAPDLAVEVVSPTDSERQLKYKVANYLAAQTVIWVVYPENQEIEVFVPGMPVQKLGINDTLDGGSVLPGFILALKDIFSKK